MIYKLPTSKWIVQCSKAEVEFHNFLIDEWVIYKCWRLIELGLKIGQERKRVKPILEEQFSSNVSASQRPKAKGWGRVAAQRSSSLPSPSNGYYFFKLKNFFQKMAFFSFKSILFCSPCISKRDGWRKCDSSNSDFGMIISGHRPVCLSQTY